MSRWIYEGILAVARALWPAYRCWAWLTGVESQELRERMGRLRPEAEALAHARPIWIQAASVGEVRLALGLIAALGASGTAPSPFYLTTTTRTARRLAGTLTGGGTLVGYCPLDFRGSAKRFMDALTPRAVLLIETEIWPNLLEAASRRSIPVLIVNGRISERAFARYRRIPALVRATLGRVTRALTQSRADADRFTSLGLPPDRVLVTGSVKSALAGAEPAPSELPALLGLASGDELWVAGSTAEGEDESVLESWLAIPDGPDLPEGRRVLVLAPRHPERFDAVASLIDQAGVPALRRSALVGSGASTSLGSLGASRTSGASGHGSRRLVVLLDSIGELASLYGSADVAFVGGTLAPVGGHNVLEPAARGVAPIVGPHTANVRETIERLLAAGGAFQVADRSELTALFAKLAGDPGLRRAAGARARAVAGENRDALDVTLRELAPFLQPIEAVGR